MKFVALALALLLAVGSRADPISHLNHARTAVSLYLQQVKGGVTGLMEQLDEPQYAAFKESLTQRMADFETRIAELQTEVSPMTDSFVNTIAEATAGFRTEVEKEIEALEVDIAPKRQVLRDTINRHIEDYTKILGDDLRPIFAQYLREQQPGAEALREKLQPKLKELHDKIIANTEETKQAAIPILESVRNKLIDQLKALKAVVTPYVDEYKDKLTQTVNQPPVTTEELTALREKITPVLMEVREKLGQVFQDIAAVVNKS